MAESNVYKENFYALTPDQVLEGVEHAGFVTTGEYIQLNSYENRVFDIHLEEERNPPELGGRVIVKFYRPLRWSREALLEEHAFLEELKATGIPAVAPLTQKNGESISVFNHIYLTLFPKTVGRMPQELNHEELAKVGRCLAQIHNIGEQQKSHHRLTMNVDSYGIPALETLQDWIAPEVVDRYNAAANNIYDFLDSELDESKFIRIHGDCHKGNLLLTDPVDKPQEFFFVDFDDFCNGPPAQDFWMLFSSDERDNQDEQEAILAGYDELRQLDRSQLRLMPALRALRIIHYGAWIARRWEDPTFPYLFPQFTEYTYWAQEVEVLERISWSL